MEMWITLRPIRPEDAPFLREMCYEAIYTPPGIPRPDRSILDIPSIAHYFREWGRPGDGGLVAETTEGECLGCAWYRLFPADDPGYGYISAEIPELSIAVAERGRGRGVGTALLTALFDQVGQAGFTHISLSVDPKNPARRLYQRLGFEPAGTDGSSVIMLKRLG